MEAMGRNVAPVLGECKHMFDQPLDTEHAFAHPAGMERTYVRRRRTVAVVAAALTAVLMSPLAAGAVRRGEPSAPAAQQVVVVVRPGDTLWSIAQRVRPGDDPREVAGEIAAVNGVEPGALAVGASLVVPLG
jgi:LysM domain-containing protein